MNIGDISLIGLTMFIVIALVQVLATGYLKKGYLPEKGKLKALAEDYPELKSQLAQNTVIIEGIRDELAQKTWAKQQVWSTKKDAYDKVWLNLLEMKDYVLERLTVDQQYYDIFLDNCGYSGLDEDMYPNEYIEDYYKQAEKHIADEKLRFNKKYNTDKYLSDLGARKSQYIDNLTASIKNIEVNSIYLDSKVKKTSDFLKDLVINHFKDNAYTWEISEQEGVSEWEWYQHIISEYENLLKAIESEMTIVRELAKRELHLNDTKKENNDAKLTSKP
ncbi:hypothetical protein VH1807_contig00022-0125 [Vibrio harveyi]|uniref:hypothetical protein n=1 Tax=Vibrio harveyi TaxID=669 RepID=UPI0010FFB508|nr:hypothetical protein [Vibrio harveyi]GEA22178.1 hypothetical protein VH1807_contig00022-0125 [Vibrio harveyi]